MVDIVMQEFQVYALLFLLGAATVKSLIDMKNWGNRRYLTELWLVFPPIFFLYDLLLRPDASYLLAAKWSFVAFLLLFFYYKTIAPVSKEDFFALIAVLSVLTPVLIPAAFLIYFVLVFVLQKKLKYRFPHHTKEIPTMQFIVIGAGAAIVLLFF